LAGKELIPVVPQPKPFIFVPPPAPAEKEMPSENDSK
jgi:hypothetical protein